MVSFRPTQHCKRPGSPHDEASIQNKVRLSVWINIEGSAIVALQELKEVALAVFSSLNNCHRFCFYWLQLRFWSHRAVDMHDFISILWYLRMVVYTKEFRDPFCTWLLDWTPGKKYEPTQYTNSCSSKPTTVIWQCPWFHSQVTNYLHIKLGMPQWGNLAWPIIENMFLALGTVSDHLHFMIMCLVS